MTPLPVNTKCQKVANLGANKSNKRFKYVNKYEKYKSSLKFSRTNKSTKYSYK